MQEIQLSELSSVLQSVCTGATLDRPTTGYIFQLLFATGLRASEALETWRWQPDPAGGYVVQLSKREKTRHIPASSIPPAILDYYANQRPFIFETYSSINNTFRIFAPGLAFEGVKRTTTCHAFRYHYIKQLRAQGLTITDIAAHIGHINENSSKGYVYALMYRGA